MFTRYILRAALALVAIAALRPGALPAQTYGVAVSPAQKTVTVPGDSRQTERFWVKNTGTAGTVHYVIMAPACNWPVRDCVWSTFALDIAQGDSGIVDVTYTAGPPGTTGSTHFDAVVNDQQTVRASGLLFVNAGPVGDSLVVTPSTGTADAPPYARAQTDTFLVRNAGGRTVDVSILGGDCIPFEMHCTFSTQSISGLAPNAEAPVTVTYTTAQPGWTGSIAFTARVNDNPAVAASTALAVRVPSQAWVETKALNPGTTTERSQCVAFQVATNAAFECGDLVIAHALPSLRVRNDDRTPALLYTSAHAAPRPVVLANVSAPSGGATNVTASLTIRRGSSDVQVAGPTPFATIPGDSTRRIALSYDASDDTTGVYPYTFTVIMTIGGVPDTLTTSDTLVVVNRKASAFGAGWWLAGYERLVRLGDGSFLWVGGDGSTRRYVRDTSRSGEAYGAPGFTRPDSLVLENGVYVRQLRHRARVEFDAAGRHVRTKDPLGFATTFEHDPTSGRLTALVHPAASAPRHQFAYGGGSTPLLQSVTGPAPTAGAPARQVALTHAQRGKVTRITDADGRFVTFGYPNANSVVVTSRTNRNGVAQSFVFATNRLVQATVPLTASESAVSAFCPAEIRGLASGGCGGAPLAPADAVTAVDGPRTDVNDVTTIRTDRFGAPLVVTDPVGNGTRLFRGDRAFPGLVTRVVHKNGWVNDARYDGRGLLAQRVEYAPLGPGADAVTSYTWDPTWERVTSITFPEGNSVSFAYDDATGNRMWQQVGTDPARRADFAYNGSSGSGALLLASVTHSADPQGARARDTLAYDALGNVSLERRAVGTVAERVTRFTNDGAGRQILAAVDIAAGGGQQRRDSTAFDLMDRAVATKAYGFGVTPAETLFTASAYDDEGNLRRLERWSVPDIPGSPIGHIVTRWGYDRADRVVADTAPDGHAESRAYDRAGNVTAVTTRRGHTITMAYDALNRLTTRSVPGVTYNDTLAGIGARDNEPYPRRPNDGARYTIPADVETFTYDPEGRLATAHNGDARVTRDYFSNGQLRSERLEVRNARSATFGHSFVSQYSYDLNGRRTAVRLPAELVPQGTRDSIAAAYDPVTGELQRVTDPLGNDFVYGYTLRGEPASLTFPGSYAQRWTYLPDGSLGTDSVLNLGAVGGARLNTAVARATAFTYDARGNLLQSADPTGFRDTVTATYSGLGYALTTRMRQDGQLQGFQVTHRYVTAEQQTYDALGNMASATTADTSWFNDVPQRTNRRPRIHTYAAGVGRLTAETSPGFWSKLYRYDRDGNTEYSSREPGGEPGPWEDRFTYYGADGRVRAADYRFLTNGLADVSPRHWVFEEYRYDALGRRVWVRAYRDCADYADLTGFDFLECHTSTLRRTVWDGERELIEIQVPGDSAQRDSVLENDDYRPHLLRDEGNNDPNPYFGRVVYVHGLALDRPVALTRYNYVDFFFGRPYTDFPPSTYALYWAARGQLSLAVCATGEVTCKQDGFAMLLDVEAQWFAYDRPRVAKQAFQGTLIHDKDDAARTTYKRNRYYDPAAGRFTQEDPIGLAGGLNLYAFAAGDPVNFSDPFGLCPIPAENCRLRERVISWADTQSKPIATLVKGLVTVLDVASEVLGSPGAATPGGGVAGGVPARVVARTPWGWTNSPAWRAAAKALSRAPEEGSTHVSVVGKVPTQAQAEELIAAGGGRVLRAEKAHAVGGVSTHTFDHLNYVTASGQRLTVRVTEVTNPYNLTRPNQ